jgi:NAD(P)-dependent dehydrogenase (short-subunit alcohol dehydrogenase family)
MSELRFHTRVALVTGAGRGLGREYAVALAMRGAHVFVNDRDDVDGTNPACAVVDEIVSQGGVATASRYDLGTRAASDAMVGDALEQCGRLDILINNAAAPPQSDVEPTLAVDVLAAVCNVEAAWDAMKAQRYGRIINTSSTVGLFGFEVESRRNAYATAKLAVVGLTKNVAAVGAAHGIHCNALAPWASTRRMDGSSASDRAWRHRTFPPRLVSPAAVFLVHEDCSVTGEVFAVGGGRVARVFIGETVGYNDPRLTPESLRDNFSAVLDMSEYTVPKTSAEELAIFARQFRNEGSHE